MSAPRGAVWTLEDDERLIALRAAGHPQHVVAKKLGRTEAATVSRAGTLRLKQIITDKKPPTQVNEIVQGMLNPPEAPAQYVSVTGTAVVSNDRTKITQLFSMPAKAWWDSPDDPNIRLLKVTPDDGEFWESPGTVISYAKMAAATLTGTRPNVGDDRKVSMQNASRSRS